MESERTTQEPSFRPGTITRLSQQRHDPDRVSLFVDGHFVLGLHADLVLTFDLHKGRDVSVDLLQSIYAADRIRAAKAAGLAYLSSRARTREEVRRRLARKGFSAEQAEEAIGRLAELGYLDDAAYARDYVRARFRNKGYGPRRIRQELRRRGVDGPHIEAALDAILSDDDTLAAARKHAGSRWARLAGEEDPRKRRRKVGQFLLRRGFSSDTAWRVIDELEGGDDGEMP